MSLELPYFKFTATEWLSGEIFLESYEIKGAFTDACALYWKEEGSLTKEGLLKRFRKKPELVEEMISLELIKEIDDELYIDFLDKQLVNFKIQKISYKLNGLKGVLIRNGVFKSVEEIPDLPFNELKKFAKTKARNNSHPPQVTAPPVAPLQPPSSIKSKSKSKSKKKSICPFFEKFWNVYDKKVGQKEKVFAEWDELSKSEHKAIMEYIPLYKKSQPDKGYRKNPLKFLRDEGWKDELINKNQNNASLVLPTGQKNY